MNRWREVWGRRRLPAASGDLLQQLIYAYAEEALARMLAKAGKAVAILDVPDAATERESELARSGALGAGEYVRKYDGLAHLYCHRAWFHAVGARHGREVETFGQVVRDYGNGPYRFNCILRATP